MDSYNTFRSTTGPELVDFLLQYLSRTIIGGFLYYHPDKVARESLVPGLDC